MSIGSRAQVLTGDDRPSGPGVPRIRWILFGLTVIVQFGVLYWPRAHGPASDLPWDKVVHVAVFAAVMWAGRWVRIPVFPLAAALLVQSVVSELVQYSVLPDRSGDVGDCAADVTGVLLVAFWARGSGRGRADADPAHGG